MSGEQGKERKRAKGRQLSHKLEWVGKRSPLTNEKAMDIRTHPSIHASDTQMWREGVPQQE